VQENHRDWSEDIGFLAGRRRKGRRNGLKKRKTKWVAASLHRKEKIKKYVGERE
jgi:hypothetical protein